MDRAAVIRTESQRFAELLGDAPPNARCPTCPDWNALDLLWHLTEVHWFWAGVLAGNARTGTDIAAVEQGKPARPSTVAELLALREQGTAALLAQLDELDDSEHRWSWWESDQTVGFTRRMQTYEATMHRVDAELTARVPVGPITAEVAAGAVDHAVDVMWGWMPSDARYEPQAVVEFVATDADRRWRVQVGHAGDWPRAERSAAGPVQATVNAPVVDLALWVWTRGGSVSTTGEPAALAALHKVVAGGMG